MDLELDDKVTLVTGAGRGIGLAIARAFAEAGAHVVAGTRSPTDELTALADSTAGSVDVVIGDLATADGPVRVVQHAVDRHGRVDVLVNNVGATPPRSGFLDVDDSDWHAVFDVTFFSAVRATRAALPAMLGGGSIVNISSINARLPFPMVVDYSAAKAAMTNLTTALSEEFAPRGIRVNAVSPGPVRTPFWTGPGGFAHAMAGPDGTVEHVMDEALPQAMGITSGRVTEASEVADVVLFLASARAANITGTDIVIDGGQVKTV
jgi:NAD(P)-dependent dehydrogenase (short-subunit alcohol dehydrogenase family)